MCLIIHSRVVPWFSWTWVVYPPFSWWCELWMMYILFRDIYVWYLIMSSSSFSLFLPSCDVSYTPGLSMTTPVLSTSTPLLLTSTPLLSVSNIVYVLLAAMSFILRPLFLFLQRLAFLLSCLYHYYPWSIVHNFLEGFWYNWCRLSGLRWYWFRLHRLSHLLSYCRRLHRLCRYYYNYCCCYPLLRWHHEYWHHFCILIKWSHLCEWR